MRSNKFESIYVFQPVIPHYRVDFFKKLCSKLDKKLYFIGSDIARNLKSVSNETFAHTKLPEHYHFFGLIWQPKVLSILIKIKHNDLVIICGNPRSLSSWFSAIYLRLYGVKVVWWGHEKSTSDGRMAFIVRHIQMRICNAILLYTENESISVRKFLPSHPVHYLNNGINNSEIIKLRMPYSSGQREKNILFIGRLTSKSRFDDLVQTSGLLDKDITIHVIGDNTLLANSENACYKNFIFHGAITDEKKISTIANACRIFVYPGNVGLSIVHSFNYGIPAVVHSSVEKHMPEISCFTNNKTGINFKKGDHIDLANKINYIINNVEALDYFSKNCIDIATRDFNTDSMSDRFINFVDQLES